MREEIVILFGIATRELGTRGTSLRLPRFSQVWVKVKRACRGQITSEQNGLQIHVFVTTSKMQVTAGRRTIKKGREFLKWEETSLPQRRWCRERWATFQHQEAAYLARPAYRWQTVSVYNVQVCYAEMSGRSLYSCVTLSIQCCVVGKNMSGGFNANIWLLVSKINTAGFSFEHVGSTYTHTDTQRLAVSPGCPIASGPNCTCPAALWRPLICLIRTDGVLTSQSSQFTVGLSWCR